MLTYENAEYKEFMNSVKSYKVSLLSNDQMNLDMTFADKNKVSRDDFLEVTFKFNEFEEKFSSIALRTPLIMQKDANSAAKSTVETGAAVVGAATAGASLLQIIFVGSMAQVWGMINGLQLIVHFPLFNLEFSASFIEIQTHILKLATFDFPLANIETATFNNFPLGADSIEGLHFDKLESRLDELSYGSMHLSANMGSVFLAFWLTTIALLFIVLGTFMQSFLPPLLKKALTWLKKVLIWNFCIRLIMEASIESIICTNLNLRFGSFYCVPWGAFVNHMYAYFFGFVFTAFPLFVVVQYCRNFGKLDDEKFKKVWGDLYEGLDTKRRVTLLFPVIFIAKRILFNMFVFYLTNATAQIMCMLHVSLGISCFLVHVRPFEEPLINNLEIFNEVMTVFILIEMLLFTKVYDTESGKQAASTGFYGLLGVIIVV